MIVGPNKAYTYPTRYAANHVFINMVITSPDTAYKEEQYALCSVANLDNHSQTVSTTWSIEACTHDVLYSKSAMAVLMLQTKKIKLDSQSVEIEFR